MTKNYVEISGIQKATNAVIALDRALIEAKISTIRVNKKEAK